MRKLASLVLVGGAALPMVAGISACNSTDRRERADAAEIPSATFATVTRGTISHTLNLAGQFQPYQMVDVHAKVSGYIKKIFVDIGDKVHAGQTLAILEVPELDAQLKGSVSELARSKDEIRRSQHEVARAESEHQAVHADYERLKQAAAAQPGLVAQQELDDARSKDLSSEAQVDAAKAALSAAQQGSDVANADRERVQDMNDYTHVTAPLNGVIVWRYADTGALIQAGTSSDVQALPVVKLSQCDLLRLRLPVPEDAIRFIREGSEVNVQVNALQRTLTGKVVRFTHNVSLATRTMETEIDVENKDLSLTPGMYADTTIVLEKHSNVLSVPLRAVMNPTGEPSVLVLDSQNRVEPRRIALGLENSSSAEVTRGLKEGDRVITGGQSNLRAGETVQPRPDAMLSGDFNSEQAGGEQ